MHRAHRFATPAVLLALGLALAGAGCGNLESSDIPASLLPEHVKVVRLQLPSLDDGQLEGIWLWRRSETTGEFVAVSEIRLGARVEDAGHEFVEYELLDPAGNSLGLVLSAAVDRTQLAPELAFWVVRFEAPGEFKASVYNAAGGSPLSSQSIQL